MLLNLFVHDASVALLSFLNFPQFLQIVLIRSVVKDCKHVLDRLLNVLHRRKGLIREALSIKWNHTADFHAVLWTVGCVELLLKS